MLAPFLLAAAGTAVLLLPGAPASRAGSWLRVTIDGETRDICAGRIDNEPGHVHFMPLSRVLHGRCLTIKGAS